MIMTRSSTHPNEQLLSLNGARRQTWGGSGRGGGYSVTLTNTQCTLAFMCSDSIERNDIDFALCLCPTFLPFLFCVPRSPPPCFPIFPSFSLSPSSHYWRWGQLHSVTGVSGRQRGPPHHPHQRFRHQPKVSFLPLSPPLLSVSPSFLPR